MSINNTPEARLQALRDSRELLTGGGSTSMFGENKAPAPKTTSLIRLSHYIVTGRDYAEREEVPAGLLMPPVMLHSGTVASMIERKYPDEVSALTGVIGHANVNALIGSPEFEAIVTQEASSYHDDACIGKRVPLAAGQVPPTEADFDYTPDEGDEYKQYDGPRNADNLVAVWKFRDGNWMDVTAHIEEEQEDSRTWGTAHKGIRIHVDTSDNPAETAAAAARSIAKQRNLL